MRFVITGGAGFIGSNTVDELVRRGHSVVVLDDLSSGQEENLADIRNKITLIKGSITDIEVVRKAMHEAEYVIHLAARTSVPKSVKDPIETNRFLRFVFRVRRDAYPAQDRDNGTAADLSVRCHKICRRVVRADFRPVLWARERFASL